MQSIRFIMIFRNIILPFLFFLKITVSYADNKQKYPDFKPSSFSKNQEIVVEKFNSIEGLKRLKSSKYKDDFYSLINFFQPQINPLYCGVASAVIVLNALKNSKSQKDLEIVKPEIYGGGSIPFRTYSQITFLNKNTNKIKKRDIIEMKNINDDKSNIDPGLTLKQLQQILVKSYKVKAKINYVENSSSSSVENFRKLIKNIFTTSNKYLIANFKGKTVGLPTSGHISPLVAYDQKTDSVLVLDVAGHKNPWYWIKADHIFKAMNTVDGSNYRGFLIVF